MHPGSGMPPAANSSPSLAAAGRDEDRWHMNLPCWPKAVYPGTDTPKTHPRKESVLHVWIWFQPQKKISRDGLPALKSPWLGLYLPVPVGT